MDTGSIRTEIINAMTASGYTISEAFSTLIINDTVEIGLSDGLIENLAGDHNYTTKDFCAMLIMQYEDLTAE